MKIISLGHRSGHGKDTTADFMIEWLTVNRPDIRVTKWSWAWKLKLICYDLYKHHKGMYPPEFYNTPEGYALRNEIIPSLGKTIVEMWIDIGEGIRHQVYEKTWAEWPRFNLNQDFDLLIAADTRKHTETSVSDVTIKVWDPRKPNRTGKSIDHELQDFPWERTILNDDSLEGLRQQAEDTIFELIHDWFPNRLNNPPCLVHVDFKGQLDQAILNSDGQAAANCIHQMSMEEAMDRVNRDNLKDYHAEHGGSYQHDDLARPGI